MQSLTPATTTTTMTTTTTNDDGDERGHRGGKKEEEAAAGEGGHRERGGLFLPSQTFQTSGSPLNVCAFNHNSVEAARG